ncbi:MAG: BtpA/SgcQ family protein [Planctomycetota bacterium]|nr:BtpA/SgcQ family protein [Planctomycetota bacterium]
MPEFLPPRALIGMIHVRALPGSPFARHTPDAITQTAVGEARTLAAAGFDALLIENMHDRPYASAPHAPHTVALMTRIGLAVREATPKLPLGVQILSLGEKEALSVALACNASFIRVENFVYAHVADEGLLGQAVAPSLLRYRREIGAERVRIFADIKKKHASHALTADLTLADAAHAAAFFGADGLIVTGGFTGRAPEAADVEACAGAVRLPVLLGSGVTPRNLPGLFRHASGAIVGSSIKRGGVWSNALDPARCRELVRARDGISAAPGRRGKR